MLPSSSMYSSSIKLPWEEWFLCLERKLDRDADMQSLPTCGLAKVQTMAKLWGDRETKLWYAFWKEVVINEQWWRIEEPPELFSRSESKMPTGSWSVRHHHIFNSSSAFLKSFQPCLFTFIVKQRQVIRKCMCRTKKTWNVKVKASKRRHRTANHSLPLWFLQSMKEGESRRAQIPNT